VEWRAGEEEREEEQIQFSGVKLRMVRFTSRNQAPAFGQKRSFAKERIEFMARGRVGETIEFAMFWKPPLRLVPTTCPERGWRKSSPHSRRPYLPANSR
jgi:hypothetical protein